MDKAKGFFGILPAPSELHRNRIGFSGNTGIA
jgi:hypothetical protein